MCKSALVRDEVERTRVQKSVIGAEDQVDLDDERQL